MAYKPIRRFDLEHKNEVYLENKVFQKQGRNPEIGQSELDDPEFRRLIAKERNRRRENEQLKFLQSIKDKVYTHYNKCNEHKNENFQYYTSLPLRELAHCPPTANGIIQIPKLYHKGRVVEATDKVPESGYTIDSILKTLIRTKYPHYLPIIRKYRRPLGTTSATFADFNKPQYSFPPLDPKRKEIVLKHVIRCMDAKPIRPLHYVDTCFTKQPKSTGTGYHNRHSFKMKLHAQLSAPPEYKDKTTCKGYFFNAFNDVSRHLVHNIKHFGMPFEYPDDFNHNNLEHIQALATRIDEFLCKYPTMMYTRCHISVEDELKQRPVYAVDELFLTLENMITFPLHIQARSESCAIMYGLETIRGSNQYLDKLAQSTRFNSYFTIDWSSFDQLMPHIITDIFFTDYLPQLLIVNKGYHRTYNYKHSDIADTDKQYTMLNNVISFLRLWFNNMTFVSATGYAYRRAYAGIPSGMLNTQYLDSFCNLYVIIDSLIEYGVTEDELLQFRFFVMGDDNSVFTPWNLLQSNSFIRFLSTYATERYGMRLSEKKVTVTDNRQYISTLSYQCSFGNPKRNLEKLIAQLCYPERGIKYKYMSMRAIGAAYASCGSNQEFLEFCKDVYHMYLPFAEPAQETDIESIQKYLPGELRYLEKIPQKIFDLEFPTLHEIRETITTWQGPLPTHPKWDRTHFMDKPDISCPDDITLSELRKQRNYVVTDCPTL
uniref:RdRp n=1 Tax=Hubei partiti-like virus 23 TaxID=1923030 RepID=A0A1L3KLI6_9VIRU|nr:RdRp [Hubei partiti-like virus 23]